jgi:hypothetical protein
VQDSRRRVANGGLSNQNSPVIGSRVLHRFAAIGAVTAQLANTGSSDGSGQATGPGADVELTQTMTADQSQPGCTETRRGIPAGCGIVVALDVTNNSDIPADDVVVTNAIPGGWLQPSLAAKQECKVVKDAITCELGTLKPGAKRSLRFEGTTEPNGTASGLVNVARVDAAGIDPHPANNVAIASQNLTASADLGVAEVPSKTTAVPGEELDDHRNQLRSLRCDQRSVIDIVGGSAPRKAI